MIQTTSRNKKNAFSTAAAVFLGAASVFGLQSCGGGGGSSTPAVSVTVAGGSVIEGDTGTQSITFTVTASAAVGGNATVNYTTSDGTAVASADYTATSGTLTIPAGATSATVTVDVAGDTDFEFDETFALTLSSPVGVALGATVSANGTITDDDDAKPKGYFTGTATFGGVDYSDVIGLAYDNRVMVFSPLSNDLYDITLTTSVTDYTGSVDVYNNGTLVQAGAVTITGTTNESQIQGTFANGSGIAVGSFDILFDTSNNRGATFDRVSTLSTPTWAGDFHGIDADTGTLSSNSLIGQYAAGDDNVELCAASGTFVIPNANLNIYQMSHDLVFQGAGTCATEYESFGHTGFASIIDSTSTDDELVYAFTNGTFALFAILNR